MVSIASLQSPNLPFAPSVLKGGTRHFHLIAEPVPQSVTTQTTIATWGYNGSTPGPVLVAYEGESLQITVTNRLPERTSVHWHGLIVPNAMDGVPEIGAGPFIDPGQSFTYSFVLRQSGTYMYHSHVDPAHQEMMGLAGMFIALPSQPVLPVQHDFVLMLQEWQVQEPAPSAQGVQVIDPLGMDFNYFTINGKSYPDADPLYVSRGDRVRIRLGNISMQSHPMHLHGHYFAVTAADGHPLPAPWYKNTINVAPGETWDIEFLADNPGNWAFHCHKPHHTANGRDHGLGGMFTFVHYA